MWVNVPHLSILIGGGWVTQMAGIFMRVQLGYEGCLSGAAMLGVVERRKKSQPCNWKQVFLNAVACSTSHCQLSMQTSSPTRGRENRQAGQAPCPWFILEINKSIPKHYVSCPFPSREWWEEKELEWWWWFKGTMKITKEEGKGSKGSKSNAALFQQVTLHMLTCMWGWYACLHVPTWGQWEEMQMNSLSSQVNAISFNLHLIVPAD